MKAKWFLRGLGVGVVLTALILCITYRNVQSSKNVIKEAKELGMVFPQTESASTEQQAEELAEEVQQQAQEVSESSVAATETTEELSDEEQKAKDKLEQSEKDLDSASVYHNKKTTFVVRSGLLSSSVAREMEEAGVIDDADAFDEFLEKNGYGKQVRSGTYKIPKDADYETIAKIITRQD